MKPETRTTITRDYSGLLALIVSGIAGVCTGLEIVRLIIWLTK
jgi:hypothetical protein